MRILIVILICCSSFYGRAQQTPNYVLASGIILVDGKIAGTGFLVNDIQTIITCDHVANRSGLITFRSVSDWKYYNLELVYSNYKYDFAILKSTTHINAVPLKFGNFEELSVGHIVNYCGYNSRNSPDELRPDISFGPAGVFKKGEFYCNNTTINFFDIVASVVQGYSGGPVVNLRGEVIGIITLNANQIDNFNEKKEAATIYSISHVASYLENFNINGR